jgi:hypothetical protein
VAIQISAILDEQKSEEASIAHEDILGPDTSVSLHNDRNHVARGSSPSATAVPGSVATPQRSHGSLERGDESAATGALRSIESCLAGSGGDAQLRKQQPRVMQHLCSVAE